MMPLLPYFLVYLSGILAALPAALISATVWMSENWWLRRFSGTAA